MVEITTAAAVTPVSGLQRPESYTMRLARRCRGAPVFAGGVPDHQAESAGERSFGG
jgi:hypothetical protein